MIRSSEWQVSIPRCLRYSSLPSSKSLTKKATCRSRSNIYFTYKGWMECTAGVKTPQETRLCRLAGWEGYYGLAAYVALALGAGHEDVAFNQILTVFFP